MVQVAKNAAVSVAARDTVVSEVKVPSLSSLFRSWEQHRGAFSSDEVADMGKALGSQVTALDPNDKIAKALADKRDEARAVLTAADNAVRTAAADKRDATVWLTRFVLLVASKDVTGAVSVKPGEVAAMLGVSSQRVSQMIAEGRTVRQMGADWSPATLSAAVKARKAGKAATLALVQGVQAAALDAAKATTDDKAAHGASTAKATVKATPAIVAAVVEKIAPTEPVKGAPIDPAAVRKYLDGIRSRLASGADVQGTPEDWRRIGADVTSLVAALSNAAKVPASK